MPPVGPSGSTRTKRAAGYDRTHEAVLAAAARCLAENGVRATSMQDVARVAGVAKGTLYNHVRTKPDLLGALVLSRVQGIAEACRELSGREGLGAALRLAGESLAADPALGGVRDREPEQLLTLLGPWVGPGWDAARQGCRAALAADHRSSGDEAVGIVLRHVLSGLLWPHDPGEDADVTAEVLARRDVAAGYLAQ